MSKCMTCRCEVSCFSTHIDESDCLAALLRERAFVNKELAYLREHHDDCHQPAANYELLLCRLAGEPTNHGNCKVAAELDRLEAENKRLVEIVEKLRNQANYVGHVRDWPEVMELVRMCCEAALATGATP